MKIRFFFSLSLLISYVITSANQNMGEIESLTYSDVGCKKDEHGSEWREVPGDDPEVQQAVKYAIKIMDREVNCCYPFELQEVEHAKAEVTGEAVKFNMLLKLKLGEREDKVKVEVHKNHQGALYLHHFKQQHHD